MPASLSCAGLGRVNTGSGKSVTDTRTGVHSYLFGFLLDWLLMQSKLTQPHPRKQEILVVDAHKLHKYARDSLKFELMGR